MKTLKTLSFILAVSMLVFSCVTQSKDVVRQKSIDAHRVVVFYTDHDAGQVTAAAIVGIRYPHVTYENIDTLTATETTALVTAMDSMHKAYILCDTATAWATQKITGANFRSISAKLYNDTTYGYVGDATATLIAATATKTKVQVLWSTLYSTLSEPLIVQYQGYNTFSEKHSTSKKTNTTTTLVDTTGSMTSAAYDGMYLVVTAGTGLGQYRLIDTNTATTFTVTPRWNPVPSQATYYVKKAAEFNEIFYDVYVNRYILSQLNDLSDPAVITNWYKLIDKNYNINTNAVGRPFQDVNYLKNTVIAGGKAIYEYTTGTTY